MLILERCLKFEAATISRYSFTGNLKLVSLPSGEIILTEKNKFDLWLPIKNKIPFIFISSSFNVLTLTRIDKGKLNKPIHIYGTYINTNLRRYLAQNIIIADIDDNYALRYQDGEAHLINKNDL